MIREILMFLLFGVPLIAAASPDYEPHRTKTTASYETGETISVECEPGDRCSLTLQKGSKEWTIRDGEFQGLILLPTHLSLVSQEQDGKFVVEVEVACEAYSGGLPAYICMAQIAVDSSRVEAVVVFKRTEIDSRDALPLIMGR